jgi:hypothetical protein
MGASLKNKPLALFVQAPKLPAVMLPRPAGA